MSKCPVCLAPVPDDFGLIECGQCGAQLIVHMDGRVEHSGAHLAEDGGSIDVPDRTVVVPESEQEGEETFSFEEPPRELEFEPPAQSELTVAIDTSELGEPESSESDTDEPPPLPSSDESENPVEPENLEGTVNFGFDEEPDAASPVYSSDGKGPGSSDSPDLSDIGAFGNSDASSARDGSLRYNLHVSGIDTSDVRLSFREAITDRKMMWDTEEILRSIKDGHVQLSNISAVKAYILVSRLRNLPVQIRWEQYAVSQS